MMIMDYSIQESPDPVTGLPVVEVTRNIDGTLRTIRIPQPEAYHMLIAYLALEAKSSPDRMRTHPDYPSLYEAIQKIGKPAPI